jgi:hypothetical protein
MQSIFHHNSSGNRAFAGSLKKKEVHSAITLHPIKRSPLMHRMHAYNLGLTATDLRQQSLYLHRDIAQMINLLQIPKTHMIARGVSLFSENDSYNFLDDHDILGERLHAVYEMTFAMKPSFLRQQSKSESTLGSRRRLQRNSRMGFSCQKHLFGLKFESQKKI